jgi:hypothetical protein
MKFELSAEDLQKVDDWLHAEVYPSILVEQREDPDRAQFIFEDRKGRSIPYFGAIGGEVTFCFSPTGIGTIMIAKCAGKEFDLTDYESW